MIPQPVIADWDDFSVSEWHRLDRIAGMYDIQLKTAYIQTVARGKPANSLLVRNVFTDCVVTTGVTTARSYGMVFDPNSPIYRRLIDSLTDGYMRVVENDSAKNKVKEILPNGLSLSERRNRLNVFGLDARSAVRLERMRQEGKSQQDIENARLHMSVQRGNLIALTEINRVVNHAIEALWIDNLRITKAKKKYGGQWFLQEGGSASVITSIAGLPKKAKKKIVTRRDNRTCDYCLPMDGMSVRLGEEFETYHGFFISPPFHPRCRCYMIVSV